MTTDAYTIGSQAASSKEDCSGKCRNEDTCVMWQWIESAGQCSLKNETGVTSALSGSLLGQRACLGVHYEIGGDPVDGAWSPWSVFVTPCIEKKTGDKNDFFHDHLRESMELFEFFFQLFGLPLK